MASRSPGSMAEFPYVEDFSFYTAQGMTLTEARARYTRSRVWSDASFVRDVDLLPAAEARLAELAAGVVTYELDVVDLTELTGISETVQVGDTVRVQDPDFVEDVRTTVVRTVRFPSRTEARPGGARAHSEPPRRSLLRELAPELVARVDPVHRPDARRLRDPQRRRLHHEPDRPRLPRGRPRQLPPRSLRDRSRRRDPLRRGPRSSLRGGRVPPRRDPLPRRPGRRGEALVGRRAALRPVRLPGARDHPWPMVARRLRSA
jgi:hypothetical protein